MSEQAEVECQDCFWESSEKDLWGDVHCPECGAVIWDCALSAEPSLSDRHDTERARLRQWENTGVAT